ncbi:hypothetical protein FY152_06465 [Agrobacterium tumefaciens]|nr:hypothetical protein FY152_06465 [Agrobacterium tumefaciens]
MTFEELTALKERHYHQLTGIPGVTAIGVGLLEDDTGELTQELGLILYQHAPEASLQASLMTTLGGAPVQVREGSFIRPHEALRTPPVPGTELKDHPRRLSDNPREKIVEPMVGGISGSPDYWSWTDTVGTIGLVVRAANGAPLIVSNAHVICRDNGQIGDDVSQPARTWLGDLAANIVALQRGNIVYQGTSYGVDAAVASPTNGRLATIGAIYNLPSPVGAAVAALNMNVTKSGVTTNITNGVVSGFYDVQQPNMRNQIGISPRRAGEVFSQPGDSGSAVIDTAGNNVVGLFWGASAQGTISLASPIQPILNLFNCTIV